MPRRKPREFINPALYKLDQKRNALEKSRLRLVTEIQRIDRSLKEIRAEYARTLNEDSPLLKLPTEVTCMIFDLFIASRRWEDPETATKAVMAEVTVSHVCKRWRDISVYYPRLWTRFSFILENVKSLGIVVHRFDMYMKRSTSQNLELFLDFRKACRTRQYPPRTAQYELISMALKQTHRWKIVTLLSDIDLLIHDRFPDLITASAPNLEYFVYAPASSSIQTADTQEAQLHTSNLNPTLLNGGTPKLRYLLLDCSSFRVPRFSDITTLRIEAQKNRPDFIYSWEAFLEILTITSLANLSIGGNIFAPPGSDDAERIVPMNNLKHLRYCNNSWMTLLLPFLRAPLLQTLSIRNEDCDFDDLESTVFRDVLAAESYFFPSLEILILIDSSAFDPFSACQLMKLTQNIKSILISHGDSEDCFLSGLQENGAFDNQCWPKLTSFTADMDWMDDIDDIVDFVLSCSKETKETLKLRISDQTHDTWKHDFSYSYEAIEERCTIEVLKIREGAETSLVLQPLWPPGVDCPKYAFKNDPFEIDIED